MTWLRALVGLLVLVTAVPALDDTEQARCRALIEQVKSHQDWVFIRNGKEHTVDEAVRLMTYKLKDQQDRLRNLDDFIDTCVTRSSTTGRIYEIRTGPDVTKPCADVLRELAKAASPKR